MKRSSFFSCLAPNDRYMVGNLYFIYLVQGVFVIGIGSLLPLMKAEYGLSYEVGGYLLSAHAVGNLITGLAAGILAIKLGLKRALLVQHILPFVGFALALVSGNPLVLVFALLLTGLGRGAIGNYNNQIVSVLSGGAAAPLNALHGFFAIGAVAAPFLVLFCTLGEDGGWRYAVWVIILLGLVSTVSSLRMEMGGVSQPAAQRGKEAFGFLADRPLRRSTAIIFCYLCVESSIMGWLVTYYIDSGMATQDFAQMLTSLLWVTILVGRFACSALSNRVSPPLMILGLCIGIAGFLAVLLMSQSLIPMLLGTIGLGLSLSGMYPTAVANAGDVFHRYPMAMGIFMTITGAGSVVTPSLIGAIAEGQGIRAGMAILLAPALLLLVLAVYNHLVVSREQAAKAPAPIGQ